MTTNIRAEFESVPGPRELEWRRTLERWKRSSLTGRAFCHREGLPEPSFYGWKRRLRSLDEGGASARRRRRSQDDIRLLPVRVTALAPGFELTLGDGRTLRIPADFRADVLARLLEALEKKPC